MKKRWFWVIGSVVLIVAIVMRANRSDAPQTVRTATLAPAQVEQTVSCNGVVEAMEGIGVFAPVSCRIGEVCVAEGQQVKKGDVLAVVDKEATLAETNDMAVKIALAGMSEELVAPDDGIVAEVPAKAGDTLKIGTPCVWLVRACDVQVRIAIREKDLRVLREGMSVRISGDGLMMLSYKGTLTEISSAASSTGSSTVVEGVVVPDEGQTDSSFRLGLSAKATVITSVIDNGYLVPYEAVLADEHGSYIYVLEQGAAHLKRIAGAVQMPGGLLLSDDSMDGVTVILEPEKVSGDGVAVTEVSS